jgi:DNA modification methylase
MVAELVPEEAEGRLPLGEVVCGDALEVLRGLPDNCVSSVVTDPPAGIGFMGLAFDHDRGGRLQWVAWLSAILAECYRVAKPGATLACWALPRTSHWTGCAIEDAGWFPFDVVTHIFGCLSEDTEVLIDGRWEQYPKAVAGHRALCYNVDADSFEWQPIQEVFVYDYCDTAVSLRSDHTDQLVTRGHRCLVERGGGFVFETAETLEPEVRVPVLEDLPGLLAALPLRQPDTGAAEHDLREDLRKDRNGAGPEETQGSAGLPMVREDVQAKEPNSLLAGEDLRVQVPGCPQGVAAWIPGTHERGRGDGPGRMDGGEPPVLPRQDDRREEPSLEGRGDVHAQARDIRADQVCPVPAGLPADGPQGRVCDGAPPVRGAGAGEVSPEDGDGSPQEPRSPGQQPAEPGTVREQPGPQAVRASRFTSTSVVRVTPVHYEGKVWCLRVPTGAFVARRNGRVFVTGNSGFPKSLDISKALDKRAGAEREVVGTTGRCIGPSQGDGAFGGQNAFRETGWQDSNLATAPATDLAREWEGYGTALKPACEFWWLARKPCEGGFAANAEKHGVSGLWIDGCRVGTAPDPASWAAHRTAVDDAGGRIGQKRANIAAMNAGLIAPPSGRYPSHLLLQHSPGCVRVGSKRVAGIVGGEVAIRRGGVALTTIGTHDHRTGYADADGLETVEEWRCVDGCVVAELDRQSGESKSSGGGARNAYCRNNTTYGRGGADVPHYDHSKGDMGFGDSGGASRFFQQFPPDAPDSPLPPDEPGFKYQSKPSRREREAGLERFEASERILIQQAQVNLQCAACGVKVKQNELPCKCGGEGVTQYRTEARPRANDHPTTKSLSLMRWLCKLTRPPSEDGGIVLDPFAGSGSTLCAALLEGREFIGVELDPHYCEIARARIAHWRAVAEEERRKAQPVLALE